MRQRLISTHKNKINQIPPDNFSPSYHSRHITLNK